MKRWNLQQIVLYSHDNRSRPLELIPGTVNIITGDSNTGKTALAEIIDYCLGSTRCDIPDFVKLRCTWVATLWIRDTTQIFLARRVPDLYQQTTSDFCLYSGSGVTAPAHTDQLSATTSDGALRRFEELLGMGEVRGETLGATTRTPKRVSLRNAMAFLFQTVDIIINPSVLLRGTQDQRRQDTIDAFPYFLGVVDEDSAAREGEFRRLRRKLRRLEREQKEAEALADQHSGRIDQLAQRGIELGMLSPDIRIATQSESLQVLRDLAGWRRGTPGTDETPSRVDKLRAEERATRSQLRAIVEQREAAEQVWRDASDFRSTSEWQTRRLETIDLLGEETDASHCPFCGTTLVKSTETVARLRESLTHLRAELADVDLERPRINRHIEELQERESELAESLKRLRLRIEAAVSEDDALRTAEDLDDRRSRLVGAAETLLDALPTETQPGEATKIAELREKIESLAAQQDPEGKEQALDAMRLHIGRLATQYLQRLPFAPEYRSAEADLNLKMLRAGIVVDSRYIPMRSIGSDENYLSMHVSFALALQRVLAERGRPVPGLIVFDQISRPYYPADRYETTFDAAKVPAEKRGESEKLKQYFDLLFDEAEQDQSLQIIVLEHAYFSDDERFSCATREQWPTGSGLVPADWPISKHG